MTEKPIYIDNLQYANWSPELFKEMEKGELSAIHATICYHENFREAIDNIIKWNRWVEKFPDRLMIGKNAKDILKAHSSGKTAIFFGFQNCLPIEDDLGLIEIFFNLGIRFMQLSYNNQSLLATGCYESSDSGITRYGKEAIREMNRVGLVIDMSHSAEKSTLQAIDISQRPITITHANPSWWHPALRNKSDNVIKSLVENGGMIGFSIYPHHLKNGSNCTLNSFCKMIADCAEKYGVENLGIGSDICQNQPDRIVEWMRNGRWTKTKDFGEGNKHNSGFPLQPAWFKKISHFPNISKGLKNIGFSVDEVNAIMGLNWLKFYDENFGSIK